LQVINIQSQLFEPVEELTDETIMTRVKEGELSELAVLFGRYQVKLYNFFLKLTLDKPASEDLVQNVFLRIIKYRHSYDSNDGRFISWMYRMARNSHFDHCAQQRKTTDRFKKLKDSHEDIPDEETYREGTFKKLDLALLKLNPEQRELIMLSRFSGLKYEEISRIYGKPALSIRVQVHRAIKNLKKIYFKQEQEENV
jgi:RNA polymerase sigma factor (sigma-70 family)